MKLLICTQKVDKNDDLLGFFHRWIEEFAKHVEMLTVICLYEGAHDLPRNVQVLSLGKETNPSRWQYVTRFYQYVWQERRNYDAVFVHMNPEYLVLGGWLWRILKKRIGLWYTHRAVNLKLRIAHAYTHTVFSASGYSFRIPSRKLHVMGHGIDVDHFRCPNRKQDEEDNKEVVIMAVGSLRPIKHQETLIRAAALLKKTWHKPFKVLLVGGKLSGWEWYTDDLHRLVNELFLEDIVVFVGSIPNSNLPTWYCCSDITVNMAPEGGVDKVVLESMAAGVPPIVANKAFEPYLGSYKSLLTFAHNDAEDLARRIIEVDGFRKNRLAPFLKSQAQKHFSVVTLVHNVLNTYETS